MQDLPSIAMRIEGHFVISKLRCALLCDVGGKHPSVLCMLLVVNFASKSAIDCESQLHRSAERRMSASADLLLACSLANTTCATINIMTTLIFIIVSLLHAFFLVVPRLEMSRGGVEAQSVASQ